MRQNLSAFHTAFKKQQSTQTGCYTIAACFPFEPLEKCMTFKDIFPELSRTLSCNFQDFQDQSDFPGLSRSWNFQEKKSRTFQEAWEPWSKNGWKKTHHTSSVTDLLTLQLYDRLFLTFAKRSYVQLRSSYQCKCYFLSSHLLYVSFVFPLFFPQHPSLWKITEHSAMP